MFICDDCAPKMNVPELEILFYPRSYGPCEVCGETKSCIDSVNYGSRREGEENNDEEEEK